MIKQNKQYIQTRKKHFLSIAIICALVIIGFMLVGFYITKERVSLFTIAAGLMVIPCAQYFTRYISFNRFKDPDEMKSVRLDTIKGNLSIYHGCIIIQERYTLFADHIVLTSKNIYFMYEKEKDLVEGKKHMISSLTAKGINIDAIRLEAITSKEKWEGLLQEIEQEALLTDSLERKEAIIEGILM
jgi:hypothetical protein